MLSFLGRQSYARTMARRLPLQFVFALFAISRIDATILVPEEVPSLLSVVYSNLPPIKKGTDSKLGVGFRLGPNADVQFQLEIGPQTNTLPVGAGSNAAADSSATKKRHTQHIGGGGGKPKEWLNAWRLEMSPGYVRNEDNDDDDEDDATGERASMTVGQQDAVAHLRQLYKPQPADR